MMRSADAGAQGPQHPPLAVVGTFFLLPVSVVAHEVAEVAWVLVVGVLDKSRTARRQFGNLWASDANILKEHHQQQRAGIVVGAITGCQVRDGEARVLEYACGIGHPQQVIKFDYR